MAEPKSAAQPKSAEAKAKEAEAQRQAEEAERKAAAEKRKELGLPEGATDAEVKDAEDAAAARAAEEDKPQEEVPRYSIEDLLANARVKFGVSRYVLAGALSKTDRKTLTVEEAKAEVERFTSKKVGQKEEKS